MAANRIVQSAITTASHSLRAARQSASFPSQGRLINVDLASPPPAVHNLASLVSLNVAVVYQIGELIVLRKTFKRKDRTIRSLFSCC